MRAGLECRKIVVTYRKPSALISIVENMTAHQLERSNPYSSHLRGYRCCCSRCLWSHNSSSPSSVGFSTGSIHMGFHINVIPNTVGRLAHQQGVLVVGSLAVLNGGES